MNKIFGIALAAMMLLSTVVSADETKEQTGADEKLKVGGVKYTGKTLNSYLVDGYQIQTVTVDRFILVKSGTWIMCDVHIEYAWTDAVGAVAPKGAIVPPVDKPGAILKAPTACFALD